MKQFERNNEFPETEATSETQQRAKPQEDTAQIAPPVIIKPNGATSEPAVVETPSQGSGQPDPFDPRNHKKSQDPRLNPSAGSSTSSLPATIDPRKPKKSWFIRIHPDQNYRAVVPLYTDVRDTLVAAAITSSGIPFLYTLTVSDSTWYESGVEVFRVATDQWVRVTPADGCYVSKPPIAKLDEPHFPDVPFRDWLERAFSKRLIKSLDDPLVRKLRGAR